MDEKDTERAFVLALVEEIRTLIKAAVRSTHPASSLAWTDMRWDMVDAAAKWSRGNEYRNLHGWLSGGWPSFVLSFEGAAWEDDEPNLRRRVRFFSGPTGRMKVVEGGTANPTIEIDDRETLLTSLRELARRVDDTRLNDLPWEFRLTEHPQKSTSQGQHG